MIARTQRQRISRPWAFQWFCRFYSKKPFRYSSQKHSPSALKMELLSLTRQKRYKFKKKEKTKTKRQLQVYTCVFCTNILASSLILSVCHQFNCAITLVHGNIAGQETIEKASFSLTSVFESFHYSIRKRKVEHHVI